MPSRFDTPEDERVYIREASEMLDRRIGTLRKWEATSVLPLLLRPKRGKRGWRYWTSDQIDGIKEWIERTDRRPGKGLPHVDRRNSDPAKVTAQIHAMRRPRGKSSSNNPEQRG